MPYQRHGPAAGLFTSCCCFTCWKLHIFHLECRKLPHFRHIFHFREIWYYYTLHSLVFLREIFPLHGFLVKFLPSLASGVEKMRDFRCRLETSSWCNPNLQTCVKRIASAKLTLKDGNLSTKIILCFLCPATWCWKDIWQKGSPEWIWRSCWHLWNFTNHKWLYVVATSGELPCNPFWKSVDNGAKHQKWVWRSTTNHPKSSHNGCYSIAFHCHKADTGRAKAHFCECFLNSGGKCLGLNTIGVGIVE